MTAAGRLVLVGTPIGNLGDLAPRAAEALATADVVCCEDTRRTGKLLSLAGIERRPFVVVNEHTEVRRDAPTPRLAWPSGERVVVVSDAGMPGVSDPGERLVAAAVAAGHPVEVVPGPSAALAALVVSGLPAGRFVFEGFLPRKGAARTERLAAVAGEPRTAVLFEAPHRVARTLSRPRRGVRPRTPRRRRPRADQAARAGVAGHAGRAPRPGRPSASRRARSCWWSRARRLPAHPTTRRSCAAVLAELAAGASARDAARAVADRLAVPRRRAYDIATPRPRRGPTPGFALGIWSLQRPDPRANGAGWGGGSAHHRELLRGQLGGHDVDQHAGALLEPRHAREPGRAGARASGTGRRGGAARCGTRGCTPRRPPCARSRASTSRIARPTAATSGGAASVTWTSCARGSTSISNGVPDQNGHTTTTRSSA